MKHLVIGLFMLITSICVAQVYQQIDKTGHITYSDSPLNHSAETVSLPTINQIRAPQAKPLINTPPEGTPGVTPAADSGQTDNNQTQLYTTFLIETPKNEETIQNQPVIPVEIKIDPPLREGDTIQLLVDGNPSGPPQTGTRFELKDVDRGTHSIAALLLGKNQAILNQSNSVTVYVHHASISTIRATQGRPPP